MNLIIAALLISAALCAGLAVGIWYTKRHYDDAADRVIEYIGTGELRAFNWCESCESRPARWAVDAPGLMRPFEVCEPCSAIVVGTRRPL